MTLHNAQLITNSDETIASSARKNHTASKSAQT